MPLKAIFQKHRFLVISLALVILIVIIDEGIFSDQKRRVNPRTAISQNLEEELKALDSHLQSIGATAIVSLDRLFSRFQRDEDMPYFIFENGEVIYWSTNRFVPKYGTLSGTYLYKFLELKSGQYVVKRKVVNNSQNRVVEIYALLPLSSESNISEDFEDTGVNAKVFGKSAYVLTNFMTDTEQDIYSPEGIFLFSYEGNPRMKIEYPVYDLAIFLLYLAAIYFFIRAGYIYSTQLAQKNLLNGLFLFGGVLLFVRILMIFYQYPLSILDWYLFEPFTYAGGIWQPSEGDLILNVLALLAVVWFVFKEMNYRSELKPVHLYAVLLLAFMLTFHFVIQLQSMIHNAQWSFDIAQEISFDLQKVLAYVAVFFNALMCVMAYHLVLKRVELFESKRRVMWLIGIIGGVSWLAAIFTSSIITVVIGLVAVYALVVLYFSLSEQLEKLNYNSFLYFFLASFIWSAIAMAVLNKEVKSQALLDKTALAIDLQSENDLTGEYLLSQAKVKIESDILIQNNITNPFSSKDLINQKIRRVYLGDYFDKYEIDILLFNGSGKPISGNNLDIDVLREVYGTSQNATDFESLYFLVDNFPQPLQQYYLFCEIKRYGTTIGHVLVQLDKKRQVNNSILPRLLLDEDDGMRDKAKMSYAFFQSGILTEQNGVFNYRRNFNTQILENEYITTDGVVEDGYLHLAFDNELNDQVLVISSPAYPLRYTMTNFSQFFLFMVAMIILIFGLTSIIVNARQEGTTISTKVQILLNFAFFLPLITVSIVVLQLVNETVETNLEAKYLETTRSAGENLSNQLYFFLQGQSGNNEEIENRIAEISQYAGADINLFNTNGQLIATNQRLIFDNDLLSPYANPNAMAGIVESRNLEQLDIERVGDLEYKSTYFGITGGDDKALIGVLSMPFFDSQEALVNEQREILSNILNSFTFIFMIFILLSFLASRVITYPFTYLTQKIKSLTLTKENEPLNWQADDEIGLLVREYNTMLLNLEKSKKALAMSEKESAWREMAQQVAHEIKNPLTPMKLKLQHLKRVLTEAPSDVAAYQKPIDNLLGQVETLSDIATSFSSFAKMPVPLSERVNLVQVLNRAIGLFNEEQAEIRKNIPRAAVWVMADEKLLGRIFNNLILNAIQARKDEVDPEIDIELIEKSNKVQVRCSDNGKGISEDIREKVFIPKFSTKEEGSGIGLAIAKRGVEHAGGSIWFESEENRGTTFFIEFPLTD